MAEFIRFEIDGPDGTVAAGQVRAGLSRLRSEYLPGVMKGIGEFMRRVMFARQFEAEGAYLGSRWEGLAPRYLEWKSRNGYSSMVGERTGAMVRAFTSEPQPFSMSGLSYPGNRPTTITAVPVLEYDANSVTVGASLFEDGEEYTEKFNAGDSFTPGRRIFGSGKIPGDVEFGIGKILSLAVAASSRIKEMEPEIATQTIDTAAMKYIDSVQLRRVAR